jgi:hypothetical protein
MDLSDHEVQPRAEADRREVDPPIQVDTATWSRAGPLGWWVKDRREWRVGYAVPTAVNGGSGLLIFVPRAASDRGCRCDQPDLYPRTFQ